MPGAGMSHTLAAPARLLTSRPYPAKLRASVWREEFLRRFRRFCCAAGAMLAAAISDGCPMGLGCARWEGMPWCC